MEDMFDFKGVCESSGIDFIVIIKYVVWGLVVNVMYVVEFEYVLWLFLCY